MPSDRPGVLAYPWPRVFRPVARSGVGGGGASSAPSVRRSPSSSGRAFTCAGSRVAAGLSKVRSPTGSRRHRPGRLPPGRSRRTGRLGVSLAVLAWHPFGVCRPRRAVRGLPASRTIPLRRSCGSRHPSRVPRRPCGFRASRPVFVHRSFAAAPFSFRGGWGRRPCGSFVPGVLRTAHVPGPRPGCSRGLAGGAFASPATPVGFADPSQCCPDSRVGAPRRRARAHLPFRLGVRPASFLVAVPLLRADGGPVRPRLLGFGPAGQYSPRILRPRYSFCAEGRVGPWLLTALGFSCTGRGTPLRTLVDLRSPAGVPVRHEPLPTGLYLSELSRRSPS